MTQPTSIYSSINWNQYYSGDKYFLLVPYESMLMFKYAKILHQYGLNDSNFCQIIDIKSFYGSKLTDFIGFATIGHDVTFLKTVLAETYFKNEDHKNAKVDSTLFAMLWVKVI